MKRINCRQLAMTLSNVEEGEPGVYGLLCVYDMDDSELCIGIFNNSKSCGQFFNTSDKVINTYVCTDRLYNNRFKIERVKL